MIYGRSLMVIGRVSGQEHNTAAPLPSRYCGDSKRLHQCKMTALVSGILWLNLCKPEKVKMQPSLFTVYQWK